jgi:molybdopterin synthase sulfur carrier subunit
LAGLKILYFAWVRERIGLDEEEIDRPAAGVTIAALLDALSRQSAGHAEAFADRARLRGALDQHFVPLDSEIGEARELAIFPPVTGG